MLCNEAVAQLWKQVLIASSSVQFTVEYKRRTHGNTDQFASQSVMIIFTFDWDFSVFKI